MFRDYDVIFISKYLYLKKTKLCIEMQSISVFLNIAKFTDFV